MRWWIGFVVVLALVGSPLSVSAQDGDEAMTAQPSNEQAASETALQLKLDAAGVGVAPSPPRTPDGYTLEEMELRVKRARIGLIASAGAYVLGMAFLIPGIASSDCPFIADVDYVYPTKCGALTYLGATLTGGGFVGMIVSGAMLGRRKRKLRKLEQADYGTPRRVQWDLARSRLVF